MMNEVQFEQHCPEWFQVTMHGYLPHRRILVSILTLQYMEAAC